MCSVIKIGSRESRLAVRQAEIIREEILRRAPELRVEIVTMKTTGDKILDKSLDKIGGKGLFVKELDQALASGKIDLAVHSLKDMPMEENEDFPILAFGRREDPRDVLVYRPGLEQLPDDPVIGTSSRRRAVQIRRIYPNCVFRGIRGNVQTRMRKLETEGLDGTLLAAAGLKRLKMESCVGRYFSVNEVVPSAGQGILAVQGGKDRNWPWLSDLDNRDSHIAALAERAFIRAAGGSCTSPLAAHARVSGNELKLTGLYYDEETEEVFTGAVCADTERAQQAGEELAEKLMTHH